MKTKTDDTQLLAEAYGKIYTEQEENSYIPKNIDKGANEKFQTELFNLLRKYNAEITIEEKSAGWNHYEHHIEIYAPSVYNEQTDEWVEGIDLEFGKYIDGK